MKTYNISFKRHRRTSLLVDPIESVIVEANNKDSANELGKAIVRDHYINRGYGNPDYMIKQYSYVINQE